MADLDDVLGKVFTKTEPKKQETMNFQAQSGAVIGHVVVASVERMNLPKPKPTVLDYVDKPAPKPITGSFIFGKVYRRRG